MQRAVAVADVLLVVHEVAASAEVVRIVLKVPAATLDEFLVVVQAETRTQARELLQFRE
jgi:hypothetical protein